MANQSSERLEHLARELAALTPEDRAKVLGEAARLGERRGHDKFTPPKLGGGSGWSGGDLSRDQLYGDDGR